MERLTTRDSDGTAITYEVDDICYRAVPGFQEIEIAGLTLSRMDTFLKSIKGKIVDRLAQYEDTGLTPEEIHELTHNSYGPLHKKLGQWIDAERDGRMVIPPCKVGDMVYYRRGRYIIGDDVKRIVLDGLDNQVIVDYNHSFMFSDFGRKVWSSREEAEAALKGENK